MLHGHLLIDIVLWADSSICGCRNNLLLAGTGATMQLAVVAGLQLWSDPDLGERRSAVGEHGAQGARLAPLRQD